MNDFKFDKKFLKRLNRLHEVEYRALDIEDVPFGFEEENIELGVEGAGTVLRFFERSPNPFDITLTTKKTYLICGIGGQKITDRNGKVIPKVDHKYYTIEDFINF